jgi:aminoglycoside phosphotransferase (APT) family kinase protein
VPREYRPPAAPTLDWVARQVHARARVTSVQRLVGGITADMDRIDVRGPDRSLTVVLRRWPDEEWADGLVAREAVALEAMRGYDVPTPELLGADEDGSRAGVRCTLTSALPGEPDLDPVDVPSWLDQLARTHAAIHAVTGRAPTAGRRDATVLPAPSPERFAEHPRSLDWLDDPGLREAAREASAGPLRDEEVLVHGDYQHFNVLWRDGLLTGVVDWPSAARGNRGTDVGHCRLNLAVLFDAALARDYLRTYERAAGARVDRLADLRALLCFDLEWQQFIPLQVAGRAPLDVAGMPGRVAAAVRDALDDLD